VTVEAEPTDCEARSDDDREEKHWVTPDVLARRCSENRRSHQFRSAANAAAERFDFEMKPRAPHASTLRP
jgi:hypothetical protein